MYTLFNHIIQQNRVGHIKRSSCCSIRFTPLNKSGSGSHHVVCPLDCLYKMRNVVNISDTYAGILMIVLRESQKPYYITRQSKWGLVIFSCSLSSYDVLIIQSFPKNWCGPPTPKTAQRIKKELGEWIGLIFDEDVDALPFQPSSSSCV